MGSRQIRAWQRFLLAALAVVLVALPSRAQTPLACGDILTNALDTIGQRHTYTYTATAGEVMSIRMVTLSGGLDSQLELRDGSSNLIATALNRIDRTLTNAGTYLIIAYDQGNN